MNTREELQKYLLTLCPNVYFQPPPNFNIKIPAIIYKLSDIDNMTANDKVYKQTLTYEVAIIDSNPDSNLIKTFSINEKVSFVRQYVVDNLIHTIFEIYY